jgi:2-polyprenyl-3-methyl-5-hydroxy-6-metoxy-1,4-benzoquinol methylase
MKLPPYPTHYWYFKGSKDGLKTRICTGDWRYVDTFLISRTAENRHGLDLLDVGRGSGTLLGLLKQRGFRTLGVIFRRSRARCGNRNGRVVVGSLEQARFRWFVYIVTLFHVMEHVTNPRLVLPKSRESSNPWRARSSSAHY